MFLLLVFTVLGLSAQQVWTVQTVPNTRLESNDIHVSDPDGYLSDSAEMNINTALCAIREQVDVFVVTLSSIGDDEPKHFATELFNYWGIGDAETNNGVLLLFVEDQHALEFETGYGAEETLTDAKCERIFRQTIVPYFRAGDYEGGLCAGVGEIVGVYGGTIPLGLQSTLPNNYYEEPEITGFEDDTSFIFILFVLFVCALPVIGIVYWMYKREKKKTSVSDTYHSFEENGVTYIDSIDTNWSGSPWEGKGCLGGLMIGFSIFVIMFLVIFFMIASFPSMEEKQYFDRVAIISLVLYLTWICFRQNHRALKMADKLAKQTISPRTVYLKASENKGTKIATWMAPWLGWVYRSIFKKRMEKCADFQCPMCQAEMAKNNGFVMPEVHAIESRVQALKFTPYRCANGHEFVLKEHGADYAKFQTCPQCGAFTLKKTKSETVKAANYSQSGEKEETYECQRCGHGLKKSVVIPMLYHYTSSSSSSGSYRSSSSRSYSSHSSSRSSGSHGGGRSGGGGYSGRW